MKKLGRPPLPAGDVRNVRLTIRFTEMEDGEIDRAIEESGKLKSDWIRDVLLEAARVHATTKKRSSPR